MLKCITFDGDSATLDSLMSYFEKLDKALEDVHEVLYKDQPEMPLFVKEGSKIIRVRREEILYLEGYGDYVKIHRTNGKCLLSQVSLKRFESILTGKEFSRVHRSYIVAIQHINYIERKRIRINNDLIPISDSYLPNLMKQLVLQE
ncbi:DNA-binding LytR/AlgR family response regulator [Parabacteroides sp. PF5-5]|uniref:LytR/AlgR family response regulator transcription factor n=1 Tax=unclassified Parabacteroides TaxID=2649774 RepID=UPI002474F454|nr:MULTISPECIES: LytTR family DNA-binding domain-containing protein [unclassified Parabacteroides]MDH6306914.1 DNA-binding LytR/AlgR family response regulator [Parabacteroides sp. PH5-39]MDH6317698.1 DNA-binding LytR/AlgR family response regulator [Parabacteroides sp. PF5-13]MDH6321715.1 DNA-binding LytR/AlgR family response regulator [Parabacteroides sp. PH5-13]MDH6325301.1 DNA-binding LytR/AlgR family response regulator [Parabacteroides sp. PH5-8]MDH6328883.1 DNA-binding LytR/AlgR family res